MKYYISLFISLLILSQVVLAENPNGRPFLLTLSADLDDYENNWGVTLPITNYMTIKHSVSMLNLDYFDTESGFDLTLLSSDPVGQTQIEFHVPLYKLFMPNNPRWKKGRKSKRGK